MDRMGERQDGRHLLVMCVSPLVSISSAHLNHLRRLEVHHLSDDYSSYFFFISLFFFFFNFVRFIRVYIFFCLFLVVAG